MGRHRQGAAIALTLCICTSPAPAKAAATVNSDGYVRIHATLQVGDEDSRDGGDRPKGGKLTECLPDFKQYDFKALLKSSQQLDVGIAFDLPDQKEVQLNPIVMAKSADFWASNLPFWFSPTCTTVLDRIDYRSPLFLAATYADRPFQVAVRRKDSAQLDPGVIAATDALWSAVAPLSKLPAGLTKIINIDAAAAALGTSNDDMERFSLQLDTQAAVAGAIPLPQARIVTLSSTSSILKRDVTIKVEMEAVQSIFPFPPAGGW